MALSRFANKYCVSCHGPAKQEGRVRLDHLPADSRAPHAAQLLSQIHIQLRDGLMPPDDAPQPSRAELREVVSGLDQVLASLRPPGQLTEDQLPNKGNLVPHGLLFGTPVSLPTASPARVWRLNSASYLQMLRGVYRSSRIKDEVVEPFALIPDRGFKDYAALYSLDEPTTEILLRNAAIIVNRQCEHELKDGAIKPKGWDTVREFVALMDPELSPTRDQIDKAVELQYRMAIGRVPTREQLDRYFALYERCAADGNRPESIKTVLQAVLLHADAIFRSELGGAQDETGRRMLTPLELAEALSFALGNRRSDVFTIAAERGDLASPMQVSELLRTALSAKDNRVDTSRLLTFFQQYFDYYRAPEVFKADRTPFPNFANEWEELGGQFPKGFIGIRGALHSPTSLVADTDALIQYVLEQDKEVLRTLLTIDVTYANATWKQDKATRQLVLAPAFVRNENNHRGIGEPHYVYGFEKWPQHQPAQPPSDQPRLGVLMQPAWLVAHSTNFENDPVRRGRWIRERLLGQTVPDLPIDVAAQVPDDPHRTYRDRLTVTRDNKCWKCHQWMDDLGLPFEQFTH
ncbi:MAG: DUF1588 domain-containing protein, partial [Planctomycetales bacterium]|nr:DUF1588 domain-containing protein [Planctomycetales bacterium]